MQSLAPETILAFPHFQVTNTLLTTLLVDCVVILLVVLVRRRLSPVPGKLQAAAESFIDYMRGVTEQVAGHRTGKIYPWVCIFFLFILISNLLGLLPGFGSIGFYHGEEFVPLLRASTSDLNMTLALALVSLVATHTLSIRTRGFGGWVGHFFPIRPLKFFLIFFFVGILEIVSELTKLLSLSLRLFGNISAGEAVLGTMSSILAFALPIPFLALEILVGVIQAMIFSMLTMAFMAVMTEHHENGG
jgi:F-type H+-transporting ATPase subunit a